jgi:FKBP-type peptidyl-prolyl cis-trans isomerase
MKIAFVTTALLLCASTFAPAQQATTHPAAPAAPAGAGSSRSAPASQPFANDIDKVSYSLGMKIAGNVKRDLPDVNVDALTRGIRDALADKTVLTDMQATRALDVHASKMRIKQDMRVQDPGRFNRQEGEAFLARNAKQPGVQTTPSGLQYRIVKQGTGPTPKATDIVTVRYRGTFIDGTEFDSSHGKAAPFRVDGVIPGWTEALKMMPVGSKWELFVPSELAYGETGGGETIGPNATLVFEVELVSIKFSEGAAGTQPAAPSR